MARVNINGRRGITASGVFSTYWKAAAVRHKTWSPFCLPVVFFMIHLRPQLSLVALCFALLPAIIGIFSGALERTRESADAEVDWRFQSLPRDAELD